VPTASAAVVPAPLAAPLTGIAAESAAALGAQAAAVAAAKRPPQRTDLVRLGYVDDLGFFVNDSDGDGWHDLCKIFFFFPVEARGKLKQSCLW